MKQIIYLFLVTLFLASCANDLNLVPLSENTAGSSYKTEADFELAINGMYNTLSDYCEYRFTLSELRSDNIYGSGDGVYNGNLFSSFQRGITATSTLSDAWSYYYNTIMCANTILEKINADIVPDKTTRERMQGEALFVRAWFHFELMRYFGKMPLVNKVLTVEESKSNPRASIGDIYTQVIGDLETAASYLPAGYTSSMQGKPTKWAAKAMLGKVYLTKSSPAYAGVEGSTTGSGEYQKAVDLFNEVIASGKFAMLNDYRSIFAYDNEGNKEVVFDIQSVSDGNSSDRGIGSMLGIVMCNSAWVQNPNNSLFAGGAMGGTSRVAKRFVEDLDINDARYDWDEDPEDNDADWPLVYNYLDDNGNTLNIPFCNKWTDRNYKPADRFNWGINLIVIRYTDVLMMKAEALIRINTTDSEADKIITDVCRRAGLAEVSGATIDDLYEARRFEFLGEFVRWDDIVRSGKFKTYIEAMRMRDDDGNRMSTTIDNNDVLYPIPYTQIQIKGGDSFKQNPGY